MTLDPAAIGGWIFATGAAVAAAYERRRSAKNSEKAAEAHSRAGQAEARREADQAILAQYDDLIKLARENADQWKKKAAEEHGEFEIYRKETHEKLNQVNALILRQTEEIAELKARTDMAPVMEKLTQVLQVLNLVLQRLSQAEAE